MIVLIDIDYEKRLIVDRLTYSYNTIDSVGFAFVVDARDGK